jgi:hypothetical protein
MATGMHLRLSKSIRASDNCAADLRGCDRDHAKLGSRSPCEDERFLGRCGVIVPWSCTVVRVSEIESGGPPKVSRSASSIFRCTREGGARGAVPALPQMLKIQQGATDGRARRSFCCTKRAACFDRRGPAPEAAAAGHSPSNKFVV